MSAARRRRIASTCAGLLLLLGTGALWEQCARTDAMSRPLPNGRLVDLGDRQLHLDCRGTGSPTVVLETGLDGYGADAWATVHDAMAKVTRTCAYSRAGIAFSTPSRAPVNARSIAHDLRRLLSLAGEQGPFVLGAHSVGALYASVFRAEHPHDVAGLVLVDPTHPDQLDALRPIAPRLAAPLPSALRVLAPLDWTGLPRVLLTLGAPSTGNQAEVARRAAPFAPTSLRAALREADGIETSIRSAKAACDGYNTPMVVLSAGRVFTPEVAASLALDASGVERASAVMARLHREWARCSRRGRHEYVSDAGHYVQFDRPDRVIGAIRDMVWIVRAESSRGSASSSR